jgi:hypothetical protein
MDSRPRARRAELHTRGVQGLFILNGGGTVSLLAFLPQAWEKAPELVPFVVSSLCAFSLGLIVAAPINFLRYDSSKAHDRAATRELGQWYGRWWRRLKWFSLIFFVTGVATLAFGAFQNRPPVPNSSESANPSAHAPVAL